MAFEHFSSMAQDSTTVLISHPLAGVVHCDLIVVLDEGEIAETGTHAELIAKNGLYAGLFNAQAQSYLHEVSDSIGGV